MRADEKDSEVMRCNWQQRVKASQQVQVNTGNTSNTEAVSVSADTQKHTHKEC